MRTRRAAEAAVVFLANMPELPSQELPCGGVQCEVKGAAKRACSMLAWPVEDAAQAQASGHCRVGRQGHCQGGWSHTGVEGGGGGHRAQGAIATPETPVSELRPRTRAREHVRTQRRREGSARLIRFDGLLSALGIEGSPADTQMPDMS